MDSKLNLFKLVDGVQVPFPNVDSQVEIFDYTYNAKRMGGAPSIAASIKYAECLDDVWDDTVHTEFNGERYFLKQTPTSTKDNSDARYKHDAEFVSERIILDNVYFYDVVSADFNDYKPVTNSTKVVFFGTIEEFVSRLNESLKYAKLQKVVDGEVQGYNVVIDNNITSEGKLITFEDQFFSGVLQEIYNVYELPYFFEGKTIHIGFEPIQGVAMPTFEYGINNQLISITKTNANNKVVNRVTGIGSSENIPYYYPNMAEKGNFEAVYYSISDTGEVISDDRIYITNSDKYGKEVSTGTGLIYSKDESKSEFKDTGSFSVSVSSERSENTGSTLLKNGNSLYFIYNQVGMPIWVNIKRDLYVTNKGRIEIPLQINQYNNYNQPVNYANEIKEITLCNPDLTDSGVHIWVEDNRIIIPNAPTDGKRYIISILYGVKYMGWTTSWSGRDYQLTINFGTPISVPYYYWLDEKNGNKYTSLDEVGLKFKYNEGGLTYTPSIGDNIIQEPLDYIEPQSSLMPSVYRGTLGAERFYNATNDTYTDDEGNEVAFDNPYTDGKPKEQIIELSDIKPTIVEMTNAQGLRIDMFSEFAYDADDNNETEEIEGTIHYKHPYFFAKLRKTDGEHAFNLFDSAIDEGEMTINMTSGHCGGCSFKVMVSDDDLKQNTVQVYEEDEQDSSGNITHRKGELKRDEDGNVLCGRKPYQAPATPQVVQQDTINNEVWIALEKDLETYGTMMPSRVVTVHDTADDDGLLPIDNLQVKSGEFIPPVEDEEPEEITTETVIRPSVEDTFVITNIRLPQAYISTAEEKLEKEIIKYLQENNKEKFTFSIKFSRIYLAENPAVAKAITENALLNISYNNNIYSLYVSSYSYKVTSSDALPEITVELTDEITVSQNALQQAITEVKGDFQNSFKYLDILGLCSPYFLRKDADDRSSGKISASMGFEAGGYLKGRSGAKIDEYGQAEVENITTRSGVITDMISTTNYASGILGAGAKLWLDENNKANLEVDNITAREGLKVTELVIQKVNSVGGVLVVSATNGEIKKVETNYIESTNGDLIADSYTVTFGNDSVFENNDIIRCSFWDNSIEDENKLRSYWVSIELIDDDVKNVVKIPATYTVNGETLKVMPKVGDKVAQMGNTTDTTRQGVIVISTENNKPYISIYDGVNTNSLGVDKLCGRFGDLSGITFNGKVLNGYGIWSNNAYLTGELNISSTGKPIEDEIKSQISKSLDRNYARLTATPVEINQITSMVSATKFIYSVTGLQKGDEITISFDWEMLDVVPETNSSIIGIQFDEVYGYYNTGFRLTLDQIGSGSGHHTFTTTITGKWDANTQTSTGEIKPTDISRLYIRFDNITIDGGSYFKISNLRVNKGNVAHAWQPAPEDEVTKLKEETYHYFNVADGQFSSIQGQITNNSGTGRNLLLGTNKGVENWQLSSSLTPIEDHYTIKEITYNGAKGVQFLKKDFEQSTWGDLFRYTLRPEFIVKDKTYKLSFDAMQSFDNSEGMRFQIMIMNPNSTGKLVSGPTIQNSYVNDEWHHYEVELKATASGEINGGQDLILLTHSTMTQVWYDIAFANLKLEQSTVSTPWSPAPEDLGQEVSRIESRITQTANTISLEIDDLEDGLKATGIDIEDKKISVTADNFSIQNNKGETTTSVDAQGNLAVSSVACRYNDGDEGTTPFVADWNAKGDGIQRWYYPNGNIRAEVGWDNDTESFIRKFDENGILLWKIGNPAEFMYDNEPIWVKIILSERYLGKGDIPKNNTSIAGVTYYKKTNVEGSTNNSVYKNNVGETLEYIDDGWYTDSGMPFMREITSSIQGVSPIIKYVRKAYHYESGKLIETSEVMWDV